MRGKHLGLAGFLLALAGLLMAVSMARGGFYIGKHEGDTLHVLEIMTRMAMGQWPHLDFQTPIGMLAFAPAAAMMRLGLGPGMAMLAAQALVAALLLPAIWWVAATRFRGAWAWAFGGFVLVLILALVHGETERAVSISMHYNRWSWALSYLMLATALLPPIAGPRRPWLEGLIIGLAFAGLALIKATYAAAFVPALAVLLIGRRDWRGIAMVILSGLAVMAIVTLMAGTGRIWLAYVGDLMRVAASDLRPQPGLPFGAVVGAPAYMGASLLAIGAVILWRQAGFKREGLAMLLLALAFFYVTYQNFGNDPQWLAFLGFALIALRPAPGLRGGLGTDLAALSRYGAVAAFAFALPSALNLAYSPFRHLTVDAAHYTPLVPGQGDLLAEKARVLPLQLVTTGDGPGSAFAAYRDAEADAELVWNGESWPDCHVDTGTVTWLTAISDDLKASGLVEGRHVFTADILSSFWLYGAFAPLPGGAPWYYGGLPGWDQAAFLLVPRCPLHPTARKTALDAVSATGVALAEVRRNDMYVLYALER